jgi:hypothetical protein
MSMSGISRWMSASTSASVLRAMPRRRPALLEEIVEPLGEPLGLDPHLVDEPSHLLELERREIEIAPARRAFRGSRPARPSSGSAPS